MTYKNQHGKISERLYKIYQKSNAQAAKELGYSTEHLFRVLSGKLPASQKLKDKFAKWTNGEYYL